MEAAIQAALGFIGSWNYKDPDGWPYKSAYSMLRELAEHRFLLGTCR